MIMNEPAIECNSHFQENEIVIMCGEKAYAELNTNQKENSARLLASHSYSIPIIIRWHMMVQRRGGSRLHHVYFNNGKAILRQHKRDACIFLSYKEIRGCADRMLQSGNFERVDIIEEIRAGNLPE